MFNFRFLSVGTNNQLHLLPIKVLMAHQSKKITLNGDYTSSVLLSVEEVFLYFKKQVRCINHNLIMHPTLFLYDDLASWMH